MSKKRLSALWIVTGLVVVILALTTGNLILKARANQEAGYIGYVSGVNSAVYVRARPSASSTILTILELDTPVLVTGREQEGDLTWYSIQTDSVEGWLPAGRISTEPPSEH